MNPYRALFICLSLRLAGSRLELDSQRANLFQPFRLEASWSEWLCAPPIVTLAYETNAASLLNLVEFVPPRSDREPNTQAQEHTSVGPSSAVDRIHLTMGRIQAGDRSLWMIVPQESAARRRHRQTAAGSSEVFPAHRQARAGRLYGLDLCPLAAPSRLCQSHSDWLCVSTSRRSHKRAELSTRFEFIAKPRLTRLDSTRLGVAHAFYSYVGALFRAQLGGCLPLASCEEDSLKARMMSVYSYPNKSAELEQF